MWLLFVDFVFRVETPHSAEPDVICQSKPLVHTSGSSCVLVPKELYVPAHCDATSVALHFMCSSGGCFNGAAQHGRGYKCDISAEESVIVRATQRCKAACGLPQR